MSDVKKLQKQSYFQRKINYEWSNGPQGHLGTFISTNTY